MKEENMACACQRKKVRGDDEHRDLINRLSRIEGQIRGIRKMVEEDCYCTDIIVQVTAAASALNSFNREILQRHIKTCVTEDIKAEKTETVDELCTVIAKMMR